ncbi:MAG: glycosyltransferase family 39 protein [Brucellaceae bacterium]|nr:glycosyltransferase family 39 protein [Brucellaceae bacterium]
MMQNSTQSAASDAHYQRMAIAVILGLLAFRLVLSAYFPIFADEAYTLVVTRFPTLSYYDHPTIAFGLPRLAAWLAGSEASLFVRLPHVLLGAASAWLIFVITRRLFGAEAGFWATLLYSTAPFFFFAASHFALPEGPLYFFLLLTLWIVLPDLLGDEKPSIGRWALAGLTLGAAMLSKYTAALFAVSVFAWMIWEPRGRRILATPAPWIAALIALACTAPIFIWNIQNDWVTLQFQSSRTHGGGFSVVRFLILQAGQIGFLWPWIWAIALVATFKALVWPRFPVERLLGLMAAFPILLFDVVALIASEMLPHWSMPGFVLAFPLVGVWFATTRPRWPRLLPRLAVIPAVILLVLAPLATLQANTAAVTRWLGLPSDSDFSWTSLSWDALRSDFAQRGIYDDPEAFIIPASWVIGGMAGYALGPEMPVAPALARPLHLAYIPDDRLPGRKHGYVISAAHLNSTDAELDWMRQVAAEKYDEIGDPWFVVQSRADAPAFTIIVLPVTGR